MDFANILFEMHIRQTTQKNPPYKYIVDNISVEEFDLSKINSITHENIDTFSKHCYSEYKNKYPDTLYGSVDINPKFWTQVVILNFKKENPFEFPNGCCNQKSCSINLFYEIVLKQLLKSST